MKFYRFLHEDKLIQIEKVIVRLDFLGRQSIIVLCPKTETAVYPLKTGQKDICWISKIQSPVDFTLALEKAEKAA